MRCTVVFEAKQAVPPADRPTVYVPARSATRWAAARV
jgi:hypothetical protein